MARTNTRPQAAKPRYDDLDTFGRRDGSVRYRDAGYHFKKDPRQVTFAARILKNDWSAAFADHEPNDLDDYEVNELDEPLFDEEKIDSDEWDDLFANWDADLEEMFPEDLQPVDDHDPVFGDRHLHTVDIDDQGSYGSYRGVYFLGQGYGLDAVFGEGYRGGNCGFSVTTRP